jgi:hypothetical protein
VRRTGLAVVHEGELILPAAGSEAEVEQVSGDARATIHYYFPVEIEVRAAPDPPDAEEIIQETLRRLERGLRSL